MRSSQLCFPNSPRAEIPQVMPASLILQGAEICDDVLRIVCVTRRGYSLEQRESERGLTYLNMGQWTPDLPRRHRAEKADEGASSCYATQPTLYWHNVLLMGSKTTALLRWLQETWTLPPWISNVPVSDRSHCVAELMGGEWTVLWIIHMGKQAIFFMKVLRKCTGTSWWVV